MTGSTSVTPAPINTVVQTVDNVIQKVLYGLGVNAAIAYITTQVPFLGLPVIKQIVGFLITKIANIIFKYLDQFVDFSIVDFQTGEEESQYLASVQALQSAITSGDQNAITKAQTAFSTTAQSIIRFDGM